MILDNAEKLTRLVEQLDVEQGGSAGLNKAAVNDSGQDSNVDVAAGYEAHDLLALYGYLIEHYSRNGNCASALCDELLLLDERQDSRRDLVVGNGNDLVNVLAAYIKGMLTGFLYLDSVRDGGNIVKALDLAVSYGVHHAGSSGGLYAVKGDSADHLLYSVGDGAITVEGGRFVGFDPAACLAPGRTTAAQETDKGILYVVKEL